MSKIMAWFLSSAMGAGIAVAMMVFVGRGARPAIITWRQAWYGEEIEVVCGGDLIE